MIEHGSDINDIQKKEVCYKLRSKGQEICVKIQNAYTGVVSGERLVLDELVVKKMSEQVVKALRQNSTKYNPFPDEVIIRHNEGNESDKGEMDNRVDTDDAKANNEIFIYREPRFSLNEVALNEKVRKQIGIAISAIKHRTTMTEEWGMSDRFFSNRAIILNFYGESGTGKSMAAEAIAKELGKKVYRVNYADLESKYVGETPKNIRKVFAEAAKDEAVIIFDEADSFLGKRLTSVTQSADYGVNITRSVLLMELEEYTGVVIFTTNLIDNYDSAFKRRILLSVYFEMPDQKAREQIWRIHLGEKIPLDEEITNTVLAEKYENLSGADIKDMVYNAALYTLEQGMDKIKLEAFDHSYEIVRERYNTHGFHKGEDK